MGRRTTFYDNSYQSRKWQVINESGLMPIELAQKADIKREQLYSSYYFSATNLIKFARATNTSIDWLLGLSDRKELR